jgi:hypothetical protein
MSFGQFVKICRQKLPDRGEQDDDHGLEYLAVHAASPFLEKPAFENIRRPKSFSEGVPKRQQRAAAQLFLALLFQLLRSATPKVHA